MHKYLESQYPFSGEIQKSIRHQSSDQSVHNQDIRDQTRTSHSDHPRGLLTVHGRVPSLPNCTSGYSMEFVVESMMCNGIEDFNAV